MVDDKQCNAPVMVDGALQCTLPAGTGLPSLSILCSFYPFVF